MMQQIDSVAVKCNRFVCWTYYLFQKHAASEHEVGARTLLFRHVKYLILDNMVITSCSFSGTLT